MDNIKSDIKIPKKIGFLTFLNVFLRSFFNQGSFSAKYRQNLGFAYSIEPVGKLLWKERELLKDFYIRHLEYYNGNPFMITLVLGAVIQMEERLRNGEGISEADINRFKKAVGPAVGSAGDRFFWSALRPFGLILSMVLFFLYHWWGIFLFLAVFNIPTLVLRWYWLKAGYKLGPKVVIEIINKKREKAIKIMEIAGTVLLTFLSVVFAFEPSYMRSAGTISIVFLFSLCIMMFRRNLSFSWIIIISLFLSLIMGMITTKISF